MEQDMRGIYEKYVFIVQNIRDVLVVCINVLNFSLFSMLMNIVQEERIRQTYAKMVPNVTC